MQPTEQHLKGVALSYHETRGECTHTHGRSIRVPSANLADRRGFLVRPEHVAAYGDGAAAAALAAGERGTACRFNRCERRGFLVRPEHVATLGDGAAASCSGGACGHVTFLLL